MVKIFDVSGKEKGDIELPKVFSVTVREDVIKRAVLAIQANRRQPYGSDKLAGFRTSAHYHGVKDRRGSMKNREIARLPRSHNTSGQQEWRARRVPQAVSGRRAHPPKVEKIWKQKVNKKEMLLALISAISATGKKEFVLRRGHKFSGELPIVLDDSVNEVKKTKDIEKLIVSLGLADELKRARSKKIRAGKGKMRGRKYKKKKSILFISDKDSNLKKSVSNIPGCDFRLLNNMTVEDLAPGAVPGRLTIWTESAIKKIGELYG